MTETKKEYTIEEKLKYPIPYKWKVQSFAKYVNPNDPTKYLSPKQGGVPTAGSCVAYIDARDVMDLLDKAVGYENWKDEYQYTNNQWLCGLSIRTKNGEWVTKWDTGVAGNMEAEKSAISDAFKRAAVKWGVGRFLYDLEIKWVKIKDKKPVDDNGQVIWDLTKHFNGK